MPDMAHTGDPWPQESRAVTSRRPRHKGACQRPALGGGHRDGNTQTLECLPGDAHLGPLDGQLMAQLMASVHCPRTCSDTA